MMRDFLHGEEQTMKKLTTVFKEKLSISYSQYTEQMNRCLEHAQEELAQIADSLYHKDRSPHELMEKLYVRFTALFFQCSLIFSQFDDIHYIWTFFNFVARFTSEWVLVNDTFKKEIILNGWLGMSLVNVILINFCNGDILLYFYRQFTRQ